MKTTTDSMLDTDTLDTIALALTPIDPPIAVKAELRERIMQRVRSPATGRPNNHLTVQFSEEGWIEVRPLVQKKTLFESAEGRGVLFRFEPGARLPAHEHDTDEECVVLQGELRIGNDIIVRAGDFHLARKGIAHAELTSPKGALFYIRTGAGFQFRPVQA